MGTLLNTCTMPTHFVQIVKGLASKWKQPIGYFLSAGPIKASVLQTLTKSCITKLQAIGLNVVALICDQGSNNRSFLGKMGENLSTGLT